MEESKFKQIIQTGRNFMKGYQNESDDFQSDQELKKPQPPLVKEAMGNEIIDLPRDFENLIMEHDFMKVITSRKSNRVYTKEKITLLQLSYLLYATQGIKDIRGKSYATLRTVPCGGARHEFECYFIAQFVEGLKPGKYHYLPMTHQIEYLGEVENIQEVMNQTVCGQSWAIKASVIFYYSMVAYRAEWRYGIYAHRVALIDLGHIGENLYLASTALGLGTCGIGAFEQDICDPLFMLDGKEEYIVYTQPVGTIEQDDTAEKAFYAFVEKEGL